MFLNVVLVVVCILLSFQRTQAGLCLEKQVENGQCIGLTKTNISATECCSNYGNYYTNKDYGSGDLFRIRLKGGRYPDCLSCDKWKGGVIKNSSILITGALVAADKCKYKKCGPNKVCKIRHKTETCVCRRPKCKRFPASPVCSNFNKTYRNICALNRYACINGSQEYVAYNGPCRDIKLPPAVLGSCQGVQCRDGEQCIEFEDQSKTSYCVQCNRLCINIPTSGPVCGVNNITYSSSCELRMATCRRGKTIGIQYNGPCKAGANCSNVVCPTDMVCLMDNNRPRCMRCSNQCDPLTTSGQSTSHQSGLSDGELCGTDHETYPNLCALKKNSCKTKRIIGVLHYGKCKTANCSSVLCQNGETCLMGDTEPHCVLCSMAHCMTLVKLALKKDPQHFYAKDMCGTDQNTYPDWCALRKTACRTGKFIDIQYQGVCKVPNNVQTNFTQTINGPSDQSYKSKINQHIVKLKNKTITVKELVSMLQTFGLKVNLENSSKLKSKTLDAYSFFCHLLRSFTKANIIGCS